VRVRARCRTHPWTTFFPLLIVPRGSIDGLLRGEKHVYVQVAIYVVISTKATYIRTYSLKKTFPNSTYLPICMDLIAKKSRNISGSIGNNNKSQIIKGSTIDGSPSHWLKCSRKHLSRRNKYIPARSPPRRRRSAMESSLPSTPSLCMQAGHRKKGNTKIQSYVYGRSTTTIDK
jgi:hypothetical protein